MVLDNVFSMQLHILELFEGLSKVIVSVMGTSSHLLEPHGLIVMNAYIVAAIFYKDIHDINTLLYVPDLKRLHSTYRVYGSISFVKITSYLEQLCRSLSVTCLLIDLSLESVEL